MENTDATSMNKHSNESSDTQSDSTTTKLPTSNICNQNFGKLIKKPELLATLEGVKTEVLPDSIPNGNKSNTTLFVKRTNFKNGPGAIVDDKSPYDGGWGNNCFAYVTVNGRFKRATSSYITTSDMSYKPKDSTVALPVQDDWIVIWTQYCSRKVKDQLRRNVTYFETRNPSYLWMNSIALIEYIGDDKDVYSSTRPHGHMRFRGEPHRRQDKALTDTVKTLRNMGVPPRQIYRQFSDLSSPSKGLAGSKQIYNAHYHENKKKFGPNFGGSASDQTLTVFRNMQLNPIYGDFVKFFFCDSKGKPGVLCYEQWQIEYCKKVCRYNPYQCSLIETDKSYNVTIGYYLTHFAYTTHEFVLRKDPNVHPIVPGIFFFHTDSTEDTFDVYHQRMAGHLRIEGKKQYDIDYIFITDKEKALKNSQMKHFPKSIHALCCKHKTDNLIDNCKYKRNSPEMNEIVDIVMGLMAGCADKLEFHRLKATVDTNGFTGTYFEDFCNDLWLFVVLPRLRAPTVIPKYQKTNGIESSNSRVKREIEHTPRSFPDAIYRTSLYAGDVKMHMIKASYGEGDWAIAPNSKLKVISRAAYENMSKQKQEAYFLKAVCGVSAVKSGKNTGLQPPQLPDMTDMSAQDRNTTRKNHNDSLALFNELKKAEMLKESEETGKPILNVSSHIKKKPNQKTAATCNKSQVRPNRMMPKK